MTVRTFSSKLYWRWQSAIRNIAGMRVDEKIWKNRKREDVRRNFDNLYSPHRAWLAEKIIECLGDSCPDDRDLLEIGSGWGPNLITLAKENKSFRLTGVDISSASVTEGKAYLNENGIEGVELFRGQCDNLSFLKSKSADVVFTDALLMYIGTDKIHKVMHEMDRIARKKICLLELHLNGIKDRYTRDGWIRDYKKLFSKLVHKDSITFTKLPLDVRNSGR